MARGPSKYSYKTGGVATVTLDVEITAGQAEAFSEAGFNTGVAVGRRIVADSGSKFTSALEAVLRRSVNAVKVNPEGIALDTSAEGIQAEMDALQAKLDLVHTAQANLESPEVS